MFMSLRRVRKCQFLQVISVCCVLSILMVFWDKLEFHVVSHMRSVSYRYLINKYDFINKSFSVSQEAAISYGNFPYLINNKDTCRDEDVLLILFVKTSPENFLRRQAIRSTWGNQTYVKRELDVNVKVVFVMGIHPDRHNQGAIQKQLQNENQIHRDIVQQAFLDTFHNLTVKLLLQFRWAHTNCAHARFLMSADDDMFIHILNLIRYLKDLSSQGVQDFWVGHVHRGSPPIRHKGSKYYMPVQMYQWPAYPDYTAGGGYVVSRDVADKIYKATLFLNASLYIDDVFMGICASTFKVSPQEHVYFSGEGKAPYHPCIYEKMITSHGHLDDISYLWKAATAPEVNGVSSGFFGKLYCTAVKIRLLCWPNFRKTYSCKAAFL